MKNKNQIKILREQIDEIDEQLFDLLDRRFGTVKKLSRIKRKIKISITDIQRQEKIIQRITQKYNKIDPKFIEEIFLSIFDYSKILQLYKIENKSLIKNLQEKPLLIAGPCSIESKEQIETISNFLKENGIKFLRGGIFKPRTSPESFQGLGIDGLIYMKDAAVKNDQYIVTEIMTEKQLDQVYDFVDVIQIGSRNMCSFGLLKAIGKKTAKDKKPILLKRGMNSTINEYLSAVKYLTKYGNNNVLLCLRGIRTFEQIDSELRNTPDLASILELKEKTNKKIIFDPSHSTGNKKHIVEISKAALKLGADGIMIEVHNKPETALSDGKQSLDFKQFNNFLKEIR